MKRFLISLTAGAVAVLAMLAPLTTAKAQDAGPLKIGVVDVDLILSKFYKWDDRQDDFKKYEKELEVTMKKMKEKIDTKKAELDVMNERLRNDSLPQAVKDDNRKKLELGIAEIQQMATEFESQRQRSLRKIDRMKRRAYLEVLEDVYKAVSEIAESKGFSLVHDKSSVSRNTNPFVLYSKDLIDFSAPVIEKLNSTKPKSP